MTKQEMEALVQRQIEAYNRRDIDAFCACYHPEITVNRLIRGTPPAVGIESFRKGFAAMFEASPKLHGQIKSRIVLDTAVIDEEWVTGSAKYPEGIHAVAVYGFRDGLIDRVWFAN